MTESEIFFNKIKASVKIISSKSEDEKQDVINIIKDIIVDFNNLEDTAFKHIPNLKRRPVLLDLLKSEVNFIETYYNHNTKNYAETQTTLLLVAQSFRQHF
jgi:hypothetical protein